MYYTVTSSYNMLILLDRRIIMQLVCFMKFLYSGLLDQGIIVVLYQYIFTLSPQVGLVTITTSVTGDPHHQCDW